MCLVPRRSAGAVAYVDHVAQRVWFCDGPARRATPEPLTAPPPDGEVHHHGGLSATPDGDWVLAVREVHRQGAGRPSRSVVALSTRGARPSETTLLDGHDFFGTPRVQPDRRPLGRGGLGSSRHAVGRLGGRGAARSSAAPGATKGAVMRSRRPRALAGGGRSRGVGRPAGLGTRRFTALSSRTGEVGGSPTSTPGSRRGQVEPIALTTLRGRVPRARLGAQSDDHRRARRRHGRGTHDDGRPRRARQAGPRRMGGRPTTAGSPRAALRVDQRALRARRRPGAHREHTGIPSERLGPDPRRACAHRCARVP